MRHHGRFDTRRRPEPPEASSQEVQSWLVGRLPDEWFTGPPAVTVDREEITVIGPMAEPEAEEGLDPQSLQEGRVRRFREETREERMKIAREAEARYQRHVAWGVEMAGDAYVFTNLSVPTMTRLRQPERLVLDTLVAAGIARSRAEALAWCVKLVGQNEQEWIDSLRSALDAVAEARQSGPA